MAARELSVVEVRRFVDTQLELAADGAPVKAHDRLWRQMTDANPLSKQWEMLRDAQHVIERNFALPCF